MTERTGYIPQKVTYVLAEPVNYKTSWDGGTFQHNQETLIHQQTVIPTFPISGDHKNYDRRLASAQRWANNGNKNIVTRDNSPFNIQICGLDVRGQGGRAYKVIDDCGHLFDLREDVMFEAMMHVGIKPGGYLNSQFIWCVRNNNTKLIRVDSILHQEMLQATIRNNQEPVPITQLKPGIVYRNKQLMSKLFVGWVPTPRCKLPCKFVWLEFWDISNKDRFKESLNTILSEHSQGRSYLQWHCTTTNHALDEYLDYSDLVPLFKEALILQTNNRLEESKADLERLELQAKKDSWPNDSEKIGRASCRERV